VIPVSKAKNDFTEDLIAILGITTDLRHLVTFVPWLHRMAEPTVKRSNESLERLGAPANSFGPLTGSSIINLLHDGQLVTKAPAGKRFSIGDDVNKMAKEVECRTNASLLTVLHETWEAYIKKSYAKLLFRASEEILLPKRAGFHESKLDWRKYRNTPKYFNDYAQWTCKTDCTEALTMFKKFLAWDQIHVTEWKGMEWTAVARCLAFCRNRIVHNEGHVSESRITRLSKHQRIFVGTLMKKTILSEKERILPSGGDLDGLIEAVASFAYALHVLLSNRCKLNVDNPLFQIGPTQR